MEKRGLRRWLGGGTTGRAPAVTGGNDGGVVVGVAGGTGSGTKAATHWATSATEEHSVSPAAVR